MPPRSTVLLVFLGASCIAGPSAAQTPDPAWDVTKARGILFDYFGNNPPASTLCVLRGLANPNFLLEIEAIAAV